MNKPQNDSQVKVAKITAFQAIAVALITVAGGSLGYFLSESGKAKSKAEIKHHWLTIKNVKYSGVTRVGIVINGNNFSYPTTKIWAGDGERNMQEKFPLPVGVERFQIAFTALVPEVSSMGGGFYSTSSPQEEISLQQLPTGERIVSFIPNASSSLIVKPFIEITYTLD
jgi:hypothetical protein